MLPFFDRGCSEFVNVLLACFALDSAVFVEDNQSRNRPDFELVCDGGVLVCVKNSCEPWHRAIVPQELLFFLVCRHEDYFKLLLALVDLVVDCD